MDFSTHLTWQPGKSQIEPKPMNEAAKIANEHSNDMNWLAVCLLFIAIIALGWLFRWIVGELKQLFREANDGRVECAKIIATNTSVIQECRDSICESTDFMKRKMNLIILGFCLMFATSCAINNYEFTEGQNTTRLRQFIFLQKANQEGLRVSPKTGFSIKSTTSETQVEVAAAVTEAAVRGAVSGAKP